MKNINLVFGILILSLCFTNCDKDDENNAVNCDQEVVVSSDQYDTAPDDALTINQLEIIDDCLKINFSASGCDGSTWVLNLIDSGALAFSLPPQRFLRLSLKDEEECEAYISKEMTFDISELMVDGNQVLLNIANSGDQILYEY